MKRPATTTKKPAISSKTPNNLLNQYLEGMEFLKAGDLKSARASLAQLVEKDPQMVQAQLALGWVNYRDGDLQAALKCVEEALAINPKSMEAKMFSARLREELGDVDRAMVDYEDAVEIDPSSGFAQMRISSIFAQNDDYTEAVRRLRDALQRNPQQIAPRLMLANMLARSGDRATAKAELQRVLDISPENWMAALSLAHLHQREGEFEAARPLVEGAIDLAPDKPAPRLAYGMLLTAQGDHQGALASFKEAMKFGANPQWTGMMMADCQIKLGQHRDALNSLRRALLRNPRPGMIHKRIGDLLTLTDRYPEAIEEYRAAALAEPDFVESEPELKALIGDEKAGVDDPKGLATRIRAQLEAIAAKRKDQRPARRPQPLANRPGRRQLGMAGQAMLRQRVLQPQWQRFAEAQTESRGDREAEQNVIFDGKGHREYVGGLWDAVGALQFRFLVEQGLQPQHVFLDVACGSLRGGVRFIPYLDTGNYLGIDIKRDLILAGIKNELGNSLYEVKKPEFVVSESFEFSQFSKKPDYALAQSLFTHLIERDLLLCMRNLRAFAKPTTKFYVTFFDSPEPVQNPENSDPHLEFRYTREQMRKFGESTGWNSRHIGNWDHPRDQQMIEYFPA